MYTAQGTIDKSQAGQAIESYLPIVKKIAVQMKARLPANVELDDLIQAGRVGLMEAWKRYQDSASASFETFATQRIRGAILDELRAMDWVPRSVRQTAREVENAIRAAAHRAGRQPSEAEIAREMQISLEQYHQQLVKIQGCQLVYAEDFAIEGEENSFFELHGAAAEERAESEDPLARMLSGEFRHLLVKAIEQLPEREARVLSLYYDEELSLREISSILEVNPSRASQLHNQVISRLRVLMRDLI